MKVKVFILLALGRVMLWGFAFAAEPVRATDIQISIAKPPVTPAAREVPKEASHQKAWDPNEHGPFTSIVVGRVSALTVTWADPQRFTNEKQTEALLRDLLSSTNTQTWKFHIWSWGDNKPGLVVEVKHIDGKDGKWVIWCPPPGLCWAYEDGDGKWWWGIWDLHKAPHPKSLETQQ